VIPIGEAGRAERLARAIVSDVMSYNPEAVRRGLEADDLFDRLADELEEGRIYFESRVAPDVAQKSNAWGRALVDVLVYRSRWQRARFW
jgi:hypothetical protein